MMSPAVLLFSLSLLLPQLCLGVPKPFSLSFSEPNPRPLPNLFFEHGLLSSRKRRKADTTAFTATSKCSAAEWRQLDEQVIIPCRQQTTDLIQTKGSDDEFVASFCRAMLASLKCATDNDAQCLNVEEQNNVKFNQILRDFEFAYNNSEALGQTLIDSCPLLKQNEAQIMREITGANKCGFMQTKAKLVQQLQCMKTANANEDDDITAANGDKAALVRALCKRKQEFDGKCRNILLPCMGDQKQAELDQDWAKAFQKAEQSLQQLNGFEVFTYAGSCSGSNRNLKFRRPSGGSGSRK